MDRSDFHREALDVIEQGLMMIGETKNEEELPVNFSDLDEKTMVQFLEAHYEFQQPFTKDELESWQGWRGRGISGEYLWSVTQQVIEPMVELLPMHLMQCAFSRPKLAPWS